MPFPLATAALRRLRHPLSAQFMAPKARRVEKSQARGVKKDTALTKAGRQAQQVQVTQQLVDLVGRRPNLAQAILDHGLKLEEEYKNSPENDVWPRNYYRLKQISVTYMLSVLRSCQPSWKENTWVKLRTQPPLSDGDPLSAIERLFYWATASNPDNVLISNRAVCTKVLVDRVPAFRAPVGHSGLRRQWLGGVALLRLFLVRAQRRE